ncbi:uncharacterized protein LOC122878480 [Siniperca chuatsi]|uniref:uncharacterized protein LOC122878480 n=1 Tax=Siniperca chuatsi TaxID=119488 RepID=UPI001CE031AC|nr:uncharacterized protein LOC122878480 [Siniperca chuatsi]
MPLRMDDIIRWKQLGPDANPNGTLLKQNRPSPVFNNVQCCVHVCLEDETPPAGRGGGGGSPCFRNNLQAAGTSTSVPVQVQSQPTAYSLCEPSAATHQPASLPDLTRSFHFQPLTAASDAQPHTQPQPTVFDSQLHLPPAATVLLHYQPLPTAFRIQPQQLSPVNWSHLQLLIASQCSHNIQLCQPTTAKPCMQVQLANCNPTCSSLRL